MLKFDLNKCYIAYLSFPFSSNPRDMTEKACLIGRKIMEKYPNIFVVVPHSSVDITMFGPPRECMKDYGAREHSLAPQIEFTILSKIDIFIQGVPDDPSISMGCIWEHSFVLWLNRTRKKQVIMLTPKDLLGEGYEDK